MNFFKNVDDRLRILGFVKERDDEYRVAYVRKDPAQGYTHCVDILHKANGHHIIQSYDRELFDGKYIGNSCVGLTYYEMKLVLKKMRQKGWKSR